MAAVRTAQATPKPAECLVITVQPESNGADPRIHPRPHAGWLDLLAAGVHGHEVELVIGKTDDPPYVAPGSPVVILCAGMIRCRFAAVRRSNGVYGYTILVEGAAIARAVPVGLPRDVLLTRWEDAFGRPPPSPVTFAGVRPAWWKDVDEVPFPTWATAGLSAEIAEKAKEFVQSFGTAKPRHAPAAPAAPLEVSGPSAPRETATAATTAPEAAPAPSPIPPEMDCNGRLVTRDEAPPEPKAKRARSPKSKPAPAEPAPKPAPPAPVEATKPTVPAVPASGQRSLF